MALLSSAKDSIMNPMWEQLQDTPSSQNTASGHEKWDAAATKIQSVIRAHLAQKEAETEKRFLEHAKHYIDGGFEKLKDMPQAPVGKSRVYLPAGLPIVLKQCGYTESQERYANMEKARKICHENRFSHLIIPKARIYKDFLIETRLPIVQGDTKKQIGFYLEHQEQMTDAVKEFTLFLCQVMVSDLTGESDDPYNTLSEEPIGRYENVAMYMEEGSSRGLIGLLDLEQILYVRDKEDVEEEEVSLACQEAIRLFPQHAKSIVLAAKKFDPDVEESRFNGHKVLKFFKKIYLDHLEFVKQKGIDFTDPINFPFLSSERTKKIWDALKEEMLREHKDKLGENSEQTLAAFETVFPTIVDEVIKFLSEQLKFKLASSGESIPLTSFSSLLTVRTIEFDKYSEEFQEFVRLVSSKLAMLTFSKPKSRFVMPMFDFILKEFEKGKEIAYFNPEFGAPRRTLCCVFC